MTKWEFLCQAPSEPERLVYCLMKFLLQSLRLFFTGEQHFLQAMFRGHQSARVIIPRLWQEEPAF